MSRNRAVLLSVLLFLVFAAALPAASLAFLPREGVRVLARAADAGRVLTGRDDPGAETLELLPGERLNINSAGVSQLQKLPGIGEGLAQAIVDYRLETGPFESPEQLMEVPGIGPSRYAAVEELITIGEASYDKSHEPLK